MYSKSGEEDKFDVSLLISFFFNCFLALEIRPMKKKAKKNPRKEEDSSSDHSCFVASVSVSNLYNDKLVNFSKTNILY